MTINDLFLDIIRTIEKDKEKYKFRYDPKIHMFALNDMGDHTIKINFQTMDPSILSDEFQIKYWGRIYTFTEEDEGVAIKIYNKGCKLYNYWKDINDKVKEEQVIESLKVFKENL